MLAKHGTQTSGPKRHDAPQAATAPTQSAAFPIEQLSLSTPTDMEGRGLPGKVAGERRPAVRERFADIDGIIM